MAAQRMNYVQPLGLGPSPSRFQIGDGRYDEAEMVERTGAAIPWRPPMQREIVASRAQIGVVRIGLPYQPHAEYPRVKLRRASDVVHPQCEMAQAAIANHWWLRPFPGRSLR